MMAQTLTLEECRAKALEHNKTLKSAQVKEQQMQSDVKSYKANYFPKLDITAVDAYKWGKTDLTLPLSSMYGEMLTSIAPMIPQLVQGGVLNSGQVNFLQNLEVKDKTLELRTKNVFYAGAMLTQPIYMGGKITAAYQMSKLGSKMASTNVRLTESQVIVSTDEAYMLAVKAKQLSQVAHKYKNLLDELQKNVDAAVAHGLKMHNDALKVQVKRNEVELNIRKADNAYRLACMNLCQVIGVDMNSDINVDEKTLKDVNINTSDPKELAKAGITSRPEYMILQDKSELARKNVQLTKSDYLPQVAFIGAYSYLNGMELEGKKLFDKGSPTVAVTVKIPVLEYFTQGRHKVTSARAQQQIAELERDEYAEKMTLELTQCANNLSEAALEIDITKKSTEQAAENMRMSKQQYEVGTEPLSDYLESQALWQQACANEVEARYQYFLAVTKYLKAAGQLK